MFPVTRKAALTRFITIVSSPSQRKSRQVYGALRRKHENGGSGLGGRAQQLALAVAERIAGSSDLVFMACGSDGSDGPTPSAGAIVDGTTWPTALAAGLDPSTALREFDAHPLLRDVGCTIETGPTGTHLTDLYLIVRLDGRDSNDI